MLFGTAGCGGHTSSHAPASRLQLPLELRRRATLFGQLQRQADHRLRVDRPLGPKLFLQQPPL